MIKVVADCGSQFGDNASFDRQRQGVRAAGLGFDQQSRQWTGFLPAHVSNDLRKWRSLMDVIEVDGSPMLLVSNGGGMAVHLAAQANGEGAREAVYEFRVKPGNAFLSSYDPHLLLRRQWSATALCGRAWVDMVGGDGGPVDRYRETAFAPTCKRCLAIMDKHFPLPAPAAQLELVAQLAADAVIEQRGFAEVHRVPGDQQDALRKAIRRLVRQRSGESVRSFVAHSVVYVYCEAIYQQHADEGQKEIAEALNAIMTGERPVARPEPEWRISWTAWDIT